MAHEHAEVQSRTQKYIRGLYSGGTFCFEASLLASAVLSPVYSNTPVGGALQLDDVWNSKAHTLRRPR